MTSAEYIEPFDKKLRGSQFGAMESFRKHPHRGTDWSAAELAPIKCITTGTVTQNAWSDVLGWFLVHRTRDGLFVLYAHLAEQSPKAVGDVVRMGDVIGRVGGGGKHKSGSASTGCHLHLAIAKSKNPHLCVYEQLLDPIKHIEANKAKPKAAPAKPAAKAASK